MSRRVDVKRILREPGPRRELFVACIQATQAREGIVTTRAQAECAYDAVQAEKAARAAKLPPGLAPTRCTEYGKVFETGRPVELRYVRNTERAGNFGPRYGQDIEPAGRYLLHNPEPGDLAWGWEAGTVAFRKPLVLKLVLDQDDGIYGPNGWKARLHRAYRARGAALTAKLRRQGFDAIVTCDLDGFTREIVDLRRRGAHR
jgi:hypothetical protein